MVHARRANGKSAYICRHVFERVAAQQLNEADHLLRRCSEARDCQCVFLIGRHSPQPVAAYFGRWAAQHRSGLGKAQVRGLSDVSE